MLTDTVGFISHLPHKLVEAFRATLEEAANASLLLHVVDAADEERHRNIERVAEVLEEIGAHELPSLLVYNKIDLLEDPRPRIDRDADGMPVAVWLSARDGLGFDLLLQAIRERVGTPMMHSVFLLQPHQSRLRAGFYQNNGVVREQVQDNGSLKLEIRMPVVDFLRLLKGQQLEPGQLTELPEFGQLAQSA